MGIRAQCLVPASDPQEADSRTSIPVKLRVSSPGIMPYGEALAMQRAAAQARVSGELTEDLLILVEHPPVVTLGRNARQANLGVSPEYLAGHGIELFDVERGGDVTFHGPGQLVGYPILDLKGLRQDLHWYLRQLEETLIVAMARYGLAGTRNRGYTGVWIGGETWGGPGTGEAGTAPPRPFPGIAAEGGDWEAAARPDSPGKDAGHPAGSGRLRKIASIGVHARDWVTWHGFALNVNTDLRYFDLMVPCGIPDVRMTSMARELGHPVDMPAMEHVVAASFRRTFGYDET